MRIFCYISLLLIFQVILKLPDEERQKLLEKYAKKISANKIKNNKIRNKEDDDKEEVADMD